MPATDNAATAPAPATEEPAVPLTLSRPLVTPVLDSRPEPRRWAVPAAPAWPAQPALDLRPAADPLVVLTVPDQGAAVLPGLPDAREWSVALAVTLLEVLAGRRPQAQLSRWLEADVLSGLAGRLGRRRAAAAGAPTLRSVHVQHPATGVAEVSVHGRLSDNPVTVALRLEARRGRWLGTALELGPLG